MTAFTAGAASGGDTQVELPEGYRRTAEAASARGTAGGPVPVKRDLMEA